jgi:hypothetical protein
MQLPRDYSGFPALALRGHQQTTLMFKFAPGEFVELHRSNLSGFAAGSQADGS